MDLTFETGIGSYLKQNGLDKGWTVLHIYNNKTIRIYLQNQQVLGEKIYEKELSKKLTVQEIENIHIHFKRGFNTNMFIKDRGLTSLANYDRYIKAANTFFDKI
jgi:hypothetical protein